MPKFTIERTIQETYKKEVKATTAVSALNKAKCKSGWRLDERMEQYNVSDPDIPERKIGF